MRLQLNSHLLLPFFQEEEEKIKAYKPVFSSRVGRGKFTTTAEEVSLLRFAGGDKINWVIVAEQLGISVGRLRKWRTENSYNVSGACLPCLYRLYEHAYMLD
jgi:hypothetical protein